MASIWPFVVAICAAFVGRVNADAGFDWIWPPPFGLDPQTMNVAPCGGFNASVTNATNYLDQLRWNQTGQTLSFMARVSTNIINNDAIVRGQDTPTEWTQISAIEASLNSQNGKPNPAEPPQFCVHVEQPVGPVLNQTIFQLIADTPAGIIFACSRISFLPTIPGGRSYFKACDTTQGNGTIANTTVPALVSAASLRAGATATAATTSPSPIAISAPVPSTGHGLSGGAIAGIVVGSVMGLIAIAALLVFLLKRRRRTSAAVQTNGNRADTPSSESSYGVGEKGSRFELGDDRPTELAGDHTQPSELVGDHKQPTELVADYQRAELPSQAGAAASDSGKQLLGHSRVPSSAATELVSPISDSGSGDRSWNTNRPRSPVSQDVSPMLARASLKQPET